MSKQIDQTERDAGDGSGHDLVTWRDGCRFLAGGTGQVVVEEVDLAVDRDSVTVGRVQARRVVVLGALVGLLGEAARVQPDAERSGEGRRPLVRSPVEGLGTRGEHLRVAQHVPHLGEQHVLPPVTRRAADELLGNRPIVVLVGGGRHLACRDPQRVPSSHHTILTQSFPEGDRTDRCGDPVAPRRTGAATPGGTVRCVPGVPHPQGRIVTLGAFPSRFEADVIIGMLRSNGIDATGAYGDGEGWVPHLAAYAGARVLVFEDDLEQARALLDAASPLEDPNEN